MSSPAASGSVSGDRGKKPLEQIAFRFCSECSNMLYPKEDENEHKLMFTCRTCNYSEEATSSCIFRNILHSAAGETAGVTQDVGSDPTVGIPAPFSGENAHAPGTRDSDALAYVFCLFCGRDIVCERCGGRPALVPATAAAAKEEEGFQDDDSGFVEFDEADIRPWTKGLDDLAAYMARTGDFFGDLMMMEEMDDEYMEDKESSQHVFAGPGSLHQTPSSLVATQTN